MKLKICLAFSIFFLAFSIPAFAPPQGTILYFRDYAPEEPMPNRGGYAESLSSPVAGTWEGDAISRTPGSTADSNTFTMTAVGYYNMSSYTSLPLAEQTVPAQTWTFVVYGLESGAKANAFARATAYTWNSTTDNVGTVFCPPTSSAVEYTTAAAPYTISISCSQFSVGIGDKIVVEVETDYQAAAQYDVTTYWGNGAYPARAGPATTILNFPPDSQLISPNDGFIDTDGSVTFNCSAITPSPNNLTNISLYGSWNDSVWKLIQTKPVTGVGVWNWTTFTQPLSSSTWLWNCNATDNSSASEFALFNKSITSGFVKTYDFKTGAYTNKSAWMNNMDEFTTVPDTMKPQGAEGSTAYTDGDYFNVSWSDNAYSMSPDAGLGDSAGAVYNFTIMEDASQISEINVSWEGHSSVQISIPIYLLNATSNIYEFLDFRSVGTSDELVNGSRRSASYNLSHYINPTTKALWVAVGEATGTETMYTDHIYVNVTVVLYCTGSDPYSGSGSWTITGDTRCDNVNLNVTGNITINAGGNLILNNTRLQMANSINNSNIWNQGNLTVANNSNISTNATNVFIVELNSAGVLNITNSILERAGNSSARMGLRVSGNRIYIRNITILNSFRGITAEGANNLTFMNSKTGNITNATIWLQNTNNSNITGNLLFCNATTCTGLYSQVGTYINFTNISGNTIISSTTERGLFLEGWGKNNTISSNKIYGGGNQLASLQLRADAAGTKVFNNITAKNNEIWVLYDPTDGIYILRVNNSLFENNTVYNSTRFGYDSANSYGNIIRNNTIVSTSASLQTISVDIMGYHNFSYNNITGGNGGAVQVSVPYVNFESDNMTSTSVGVGLTFSSGSGNNIVNNSRIVGNPGVNIQTPSNNIQIIRGNITSLGTTSNTIQNSGDNLKVIETWLSKGSSGYFLLQTAGSTDFINISGFSPKGSVSITSGTLRTYWYVDVYVNDTSGTALENANVTFWNATENFYLWNLTNSTGYTNRHTIKEYNQTSAGVVNSSNYTINATLAGYDDNNTWATITQKRLVVITLSEGFIQQNPIYNLTEAITTSDNRNRESNLNRSKNDTSKATDISNRSVGFLRQVTDSPEFALIIKRLNSLWRSLTDTATYSLSLFREGNFNRIASETSTFTLSIGKMYATIRNVAIDTLSFTDGTDRLLSLIRSASHSITITSVSLREVMYERFISFSITITDLVNRILEGGAGNEYERFVSDISTISISISKRLSVVRDVAIDTLAYIADFIRSMGLIRFVATDTLTNTLSINGLYSAIRSIGETSTFTLSILRTGFETNVFVQQAMSIGLTIKRIVESGAAAAAGAGILIINAFRSNAIAVSALFFISLAISLSAYTFNRQKTNINREEVR